MAAEQNFDAWGRKRNPSTWTYTGISSNPDWLYRGFTAHEELPQFGLINMNGRLYDPVLGSDAGKGFIIGAVSSGISSLLDGTFFGPKNLYFTAPEDLQGVAIDPTNENLCTFCDKYFPGYDDKYGVASIEVKNLGKKLGLTVHYEQSSFSAVYISPRAFSSDRLLFLAVGHEFVHAYHWKIGFYQQIMREVGGQKGADIAHNWSEYDAYSWSVKAAPSAGYYGEDSCFLTQWTQFRDKYSGLIGKYNLEHRYVNMPGFPMTWPKN